MANETAATSLLQRFLQKTYKPIYNWVTGNFATKQELAAISGGGGGSYAAPTYDPTTRTITFPSTSGATYDAQTRTITL